MSVYIRVTVSHAFLNAITCSSAAEFDPLIRFIGLEGFNSPFRYIILENTII